MSAIELGVRFLLGGAVVSSFSLIGEVVSPKSFAGIFGAAPSVALASVALTVHQHGAVYGAVEVRSMLLGSIAFLAYVAAVKWLLVRRRMSALAASLLSMPVWFGVGFLLLLCLRSVER